MRAELEHHLERLDDGNYRLCSREVYKPLDPTMRKFEVLNIETGVVFIGDYMEESNLYVSEPGEVSWIDNPKYKIIKEIE